jgi:hypothetical protein
VLLAAAEAEEVAAPRVRTVAAGALRLLTEVGVLILLRMDSRASPQSASASVQLLPVAVAVVVGAAAAAAAAAELRQLRSAAQQLSALLPCQRREPGVAGLPLALAAVVAALELRPPAAAAAAAKEEAVRPRASNSSTRPRPSTTIDPDPQSMRARP